MKGAPHNYAAICAHPSQRTSTVAPVVRGFKIDGDEGGRGRRRALGGGRVRGCKEWHRGWQGTPAAMDNMIYRSMLEPILFL